MRPLVALPSFLLVGLLVSSCGGGNAASQLAKAPDYSPRDQTKCGVAKSQQRPLIVEWPSADRQELESKVHEGIVVVRYQGCEMDVLERCSVPAKYGYRGTTIAQDKVVVKDEDDLYANLPVGAAKLEGKLERSGQLTVNMDLVGRYEAEKPTVRADELQGECTGATHFVYGLAVGAFDFYAGGEAQVGASAGVGGIGAGGHSQADRETLTKNGEPDACTKATTDDKAPPQGCGALIRIEVVPLGEARASVPSCPEGTQWDGSQCMGRKVVTQVDCPAGAKWNGSQCTATTATTGPKCKSLDADDCDAQCHAGDAASCTQLGILFSGGFGRMHGQPTPKDPSRGVPFEQMGCDGGDMLGCLNMGQILVSGLGLPTDKARALTFFDRACSAGWGAGCQWASTATSDAQAASRYQQRAKDLKQSLPWEPTTH